MMGRAIWDTPLFDAAPVGMLVLDGSGRILAVNQRGTAISGHSTASASGLDYLRFVHPDDVPASRDDFQQLLTGATDWVERELRFFHKNGSIEWVRVTASAQRRRDGNLEYVVGTVESIGARKAAEEISAENEARLREAQALAHLGSFRWDALTNQVTWSDELYRIYGQQPRSSPATFEAYLAVVHPDHREQVRRVVTRTLETGEPFAHEYRIVRPDGVLRWVLGLARTVKNDSGQVVGLEGVCHDITERKVAEEEIQRVSAFHEAVIRTAAEGISVSYPIAEFPFLRFSVWNERMVEITGWTMEEVNERGWLQTAYPDGEQRARVVARIDEMYAGKSFQAEEYEITRRDGTKRILAISTRTIPSTQGEPATVAMAQDVTERRQAEARVLAQDRELREAHRLESLGILAGGIAHDFNNLLTAMFGYLGLAREEIPASSPAQSLLNAADQAARRAAELTQQMLAYSGRGTFEVRPVDMSSLVADMSALLKTVISKKATLSCSCPANLPLVEADVTQMRQVTMNLLTNASDALNDREGEIRVRTLVERMETPPLGNVNHGAEFNPGLFVVIEVADTGAGMTADTIERMFDPFFTTKFTGRGLGLSAVRGIVRGHKGFIEVKSVVGAGSTFRIYLPCIERAVNLPTMPEPTVANIALKGTVLVVEDEPGVRALARLVLESAGLKVLLAADGVEGVAELRAHSDEVRLILLDLTMPKQSGVETLPQLHEIRPHLPVVLMSGYSEDEVATRMDGLDIQGFLQKPFDGKRLIHAVYKALAK